MFNHPVDKSRAPQYVDNDPFAFVNPPWATSAAASSSGAGPSQSRSFGGHQHQQQQHQQPDHTGGMDWTATTDLHTQFHHNPHVADANPVDHMDLGHLDPAQGDVGGLGSPVGGGGGGGGVGRLVAHFENKGFAPAQPAPVSAPAPPLPPRPVHNPMNHVDTSAQASMFGAFNHIPDHNRVSSPIASPTDTNYGSWGAHSRVMSPIATSPTPLSFGNFHNDSRVSSPVAAAPSGQYGSLDDFMSNNRMNSPMVASAPQPTPAVPGTPGFEIWRPPVPMTPKPTQAQFNPNNNATTTGGFFKPPVPTTPKPVMNAGNQFILEFNPGAKGKGKATAKPAKPRVAPPAPPPFSLQIQEEPSTPKLTDESSLSASVPKSSAPPQPSSSAARPSREQVPAEAWEQFKTTIRSLYLEERKPLKEVMSIMADKHGFQATPKMYKTRFSQWGFVKNNTEDEVKRLLSMKFQRDAEGKVSEFVRNGRVVNLGTYLKRKGVTEYDLIDFETPADLPSHVRCRTPTPPPAPDYLRSPDLLRAHELVVSNMRKAFLHCRQFEVETDTHVGWSSTMVWGAGSSDLLLEANFYFEARDADQGGQCLMRAFKQLEMDLKKLSPQGIQELLLGMVHRDPGMMTALCKYLAAYSTTNFERSHPLRQIFTCLYEVQQKHGSATLSDLLWGSIPTVAEELEAIYGRRHPYVARAWIDLALFYNHVNPERLEKLVIELRALHRQLEQRQGNGTVEALTLRYAILQLLYAANAHSVATKEAAVELYHILKNLGLVITARDSRPNAVCYHSPLKVDPWTKRCRRRYDSLVAIMEEHVGIRMHLYFEEDPHTVEHAPDPQDSWAAAMGQMGGMKWGFI